MYIHKHISVTIHQCIYHDIKYIKINICSQRLTTVIQIFSYYTYKEVFQLYIGNNTFLDFSSFNKHFV
jgi:hypothetical protein